MNRPRPRPVLTPTGPVESSPSNATLGEERPAPADPAPAATTAESSDPPAPARAA